MHPPEKKKNTSTSAFQSGGFPTFPSGSNCTFSRLANSLSLGKPISSSSRENRFFPKFELTPTSKQSSTVRFVPSSSSRETAIQVFQNPYQPMVTRADPYQTTVVRALLAPGLFLLCFGPPYKHFPPIVPTSFSLPRPPWYQNIAAAAATAVHAVGVEVRRTVATAVAAEVAVDSTC